MPLPLVYMGGDFNCHSYMWDPGFPYHHAAAISLLETAAIMGLELVESDNSGPTFISHNPDLRPSVIDLVFVRSEDSIAIQSHRHLHLQASSDHVPIGVSIGLDLNAPPVAAVLIHEPLVVAKVSSYIHSGNCPSCWAVCQQPIFGPRQRYAVATLLAITQCHCCHHLACV